MDQLDLSDFFNTKSQANEFVTHLSAISDEIYQTNFNLEKILMEEFGIRKKDKFISLLRENKISVDSASALKEFLGKIQTKISTLPIITLTVAFEPKEPTLAALSEWFLINMNKQVLFEITVDPDIIAGAAINFNGKFQDYSIKLKFEEILKKILTTSAQSVTPVMQKPANLPENGQISKATSQNNETPQIVSPNEGHQNIEDISFGR
jgi:F0F1-type ATP synthase delta subunit